MKLARIALTPTIAAISVVLFAALGVRGELVTYDSSYMKKDDPTVVLAETRLDRVSFSSATVNGGYVSAGYKGMSVDPVNVVTGEDFISAQFQFESLKCVKVVLRQSGRDVVAYAEYAKYSAGSKVGYDFDTGGSVYSVATSASATGYGIASLTFDVQPGDSVLITGSPGEYGDPDPGYGRTEDLSPGTTYTFTGPADRTDGDTIWTCTGWEFVTEADGVRTTGIGRTAEITYSTAGTLTWILDVKHRVEFVCEGGDVDTNKLWYSHGERAEVRFTPSDGRTFYRWRGDVAEERATDNPLVLDVDRPLRISTVAGKEVKVPEDFATVAAALEASPDGSTIRVAAGTYDVPSELVVTNDIRLVGTNREVTVIRYAGATAGRVLNVSNANARVSGLTITGGYGVIGAGVWMDIGTIRDCIIRGNGKKNASQHGGGLAVGPDALISCCVISNNVGNWGSAVYGNKGGHIDNSLVCHNHATYRGGIQLGGYGTVSNCTVVANTANYTFHSIWSVRTVVNTIFDHYDSVTSFDTCCFIGCTAKGTDPIEGDTTLFVDPGHDDFRVRYHSPCWNAAKTLPGMESQTDVDGNPRIRGGAPDVGCYECEYDHVTCRIEFPPEMYYTGEPMVFSPYVMEDYAPYYDSYIRLTAEDGSTETFTGSETVEVAPPGFGVLSMELFVTNRENASLAGSASYPHAIRVGSSIARVVPPGTPGAGDGVWPYETWAKATTNLQLAIDTASTGAKVVVSNGTYLLSAQICVSNSVSLVSFGGREDTVLKYANGDAAGRCLYVDGERCRVSGFTVTGGYGVEGAGVYLNSGTLADSVLRGNGVSSATKDGAGVYMKTRSTYVTGCVITNNIGNTGAGLRDIAGGRVDSCVICRNTASYRGGGVCMHTSYSTLTNCTVLGNTATYNMRGIWQAKTAVNCIVDTYDSIGKMVSCCFVGCTPTGDDPITDDPRFVNAAAGDYRIGIDSPLVNAGTNGTWMAGALDAGGDPRISGRVVDVGAYEYDLSKLKCTAYKLNPDTLAGDAQTFSCQVFDDGSGHTYDYEWTFVERRGEVLKFYEPEFTHTFPAAGLYDVTLVATDRADPSCVATDARPGFLHVGAVTNYVISADCPGAGDGVWPYDTPAKATTNVQAALDESVNGATVFCGPGAYDLVCALSVTNAIRFAGAGYDASFLRHAAGAPEDRVVRLSNAGAVMSDFNISGGNTDEDGKGVYISGGRLEDCVVQNNKKTKKNGAIFLATSDSSVSRCIITNNTASTGGGVAFGSNVAAAIDNCLIWKNFASYAGGAGSMGAGTVSNCTVMANTANYTTGGFTGLGAKVKIVNTIIHAYNGSATFENCCFVGCTAKGTDPITDDPMFKDAAKGDYHLKRRSPCVNAGLGAEWMDAATDLDGRPRVKHVTPAGERLVDVGCYESVWRPGGLMLLVR